MARYDSRTTTFSPEGRLFQVEYAIKAIQNAGACLGIKARDGIILAAEKKDLSKLLATPKSSDKLYRLDRHVLCAAAGLTSDANVLINYLRRQAQHHRAAFQEPQPVEQLLRQVCDLKQGYTQYGGQRPFGVSFLYAGYDDINGFQLYHSDPSGNYAGWNALAIGKNDVDANQTLKEEFDVKKGMSVDEAKVLAVKCFKKILDTTEDLEKKIEFVVVRKMEKGDVEMENVAEEEVKKIFDAVTQEERDAAAAANNN